MTGQPAVNVGDYVVARHANGDKVYGEVVQIGSKATHWCVRVGSIVWCFATAKGWSLERAERPQPPLADGVYQHRDGSLIRIVRGDTVVIPAFPGCAPMDLADWHDRSDYGYVGPEVSR